MALAWVITTGTATKVVHLVTKIQGFVEFFGAIGGCRCVVNVNISVVPSSFGVSEGFSV